MNDAALGEALSRLADFANDGRDDQNVRLGELFQLFMKMERALGNIECDESGDALDDKSEMLCSVQSRIMDIAAELPASSFEGILYKLALWRADYGENEQQLSNLQRADAVVFSLYRDLLILTKDGAATLEETDGSERVWPNMPRH